MLNDKEIRIQKVADGNYQLFINDEFVYSDSDYFNIFEYLNKLEEDKQCFGQDC
mgnify:CR=1 FL=1